MCMYSCISPIRGELYWYVGFVVFLTVFAYSQRLPPWCIQQKISLSFCKRLWAAGPRPVTVAMKSLPGPLAINSKRNSKGNSKGPGIY